MAADLQLIGTVSTLLLHHLQSSTEQTIPQFFLDISSTFSVGLQCASLTRLACGQAYLTCKNAAASRGACVVPCTLLVLLQTRMFH